MWAVLTNCFLTTGAAAADHVRVILDTSGSMVHNDQPRLAILSTILLYDLAKPNLTLDNTFKVIPFDPHMPEWRSGPPPTVSGTWVTPSWDSQHARDLRDPFVTAVKAFQYRAPHTYYYPYLLAAISDIEQTRAAPSDRRFIVLVTDGVPEDPDPDRIKEELVPRLRQHNIRLFILAFGPQAAGHSETIQKALGGTNVGELLVDQDGSRLLLHMIEIFSHSFGYTADQPQVVSGATELDLEGHQTPDRVAVAVYWTNPNKPQLRLAPPPGGNVNNPEGVRNASVSGASYSMTWVLAPQPGTFMLSSDGTGATAVVLRPTRLTVETQGPCGQLPPAVVAGARFHVHLLVTPSEHRGDPGQVELSYQVHGPRVGSGFEWDGERGAPDGLGIPEAEGRCFEISPAFDRDPSPSEEYYHGYLTVELRRGGALVGSLTGDLAPRISVYPHFHLRPDPAGGNARVDEHERDLQRREWGCATFNLDLSGRLPHPNQSTYSLRAVMDQSLQSDPRLFGAQYKLDKEALQYEAVRDSRSGDWSTGRRLSKDQLLGRHEICVQVGKPKELRADRTVRLKVEFTLNQYPYDSRSLTEPFTLVAGIAPPSWREKYSASLALGLGLALILMQLWYFRYRPELPPDLRFSTGKGGLAASSYLLGEGSVTRRWLGLLVEKPAFADNGSYTLGWVRPNTDELYEFRPAKGVTVEECDHNEEYGMLRVSKGYRVKTDRGEYRLRLEYP